MAINSPSRPVMRAGSTKAYAVASDKRLEVADREIFTFCEMRLCSFSETQKGATLIFNSFLSKWPLWVKERRKIMSAMTAAFFRSCRRVWATVAPPTAVNRACYSRRNLIHLLTL